MAKKFYFLQVQSYNNILNITFKLNESFKEMNV